MTNPRGSALIDKKMKKEAYARMVTAGDSESDIQLLKLTSAPGILYMGSRR